VSGCEAFRAVDVLDVPGLAVELDGHVHRVRFHRHLRFLVKLEALPSALTRDLPRRVLYRLFGLLGRRCQHDSRRVSAPLVDRRTELGKQADGLLRHLDQIALKRAEGVLVGVPREVDGLPIRIYLNPLPQRQYRVLVPTDFGQCDRRLKLLVLVQRDPKARQPTWLLTCAPGVASAGNPVDRCRLGGAGRDADRNDGLLAAVIVDHDVAGLHQGHQGIAGRDSASACCRRSFEIRADVLAAGRAKCDCLVFTTRVGTPLDTHNVRRDFRKVAEAAGLTAGEWTPRELRHSFVSLLSDDGMPIEHIARLVGHTSTAVTETVYRQQIRPVIVGGAEAMDRIFRESAPASEPIVTQLVTQRPIP
jgi:hypothetical protein